MEWHHEGQVITMTTEGWFVVVDTIGKEIGPATLLKPAGNQLPDANGNLQAAYDKAKALAVQP